jgi:tetratricopeptide (TPR) repeat protein
MHREFEGKFKEAEEIYNKIKVENPTNLSVMKRLVCIHKAQSNYNKAITELNDILKIYVTDIATWEELGELYLWESNYQAALFCYEELLVLDSTNSNYHVRVADIYYTLGEYDGLMKARKHYTFALNLLAPALNPRGLYGLLTTAKILAQEYYNGNEEGVKRSSLYSKEDEAVNKALVDFANDEVAKHFAKKALGKVITKALVSA